MGSRCAVFVAGMPRTARRRDHEADASASARLRLWASQFGALTADRGAEAVAHRGFGVLQFEGPGDAASLIRAVASTPPSDAEGVICTRAELSSGGRAAASEPAPEPEPEPDPEPEPEPEAPNLVLSVVRTHTSRVIAFLREEDAPQCRVLGWQPQPSLGRAKEHTVLLRVDAGTPESVAVCARAIASEITLATAVRKVLPLDDGQYPTLEAAVEALGRRLGAEMETEAYEGTAANVAAAVGVRVQALPVTALPTVLDTLADDRRVTEGSPPRQRRWQLVPQDSALVASVVQLADAGGYHHAQPPAQWQQHWRIGLASFPDGHSQAQSERAARGFSSHNSGGEGGGDPNADAAAVCRAFYKLTEAVRRTAARSFCFDGAWALDAGAAPGGWTKYLALDRQCARVFAVDPGALELAGLSPDGAALPSNVKYMPCLLDVALPAIAAELQAAGGSGGRAKQLDVFVTDLVPNRGLGLVEIVTPLFTWSPPLLRPGALVVPRTRNPQHSLVPRGISERLLVFSGHDVQGAHRALGAGLGGAGASTGRPAARVPGGGVAAAPDGQPEGGADARRLRQVSNKLQNKTTTCIKGHRPGQFLKTRPGIHSRQREHIQRKNTRLHMPMF